MLMTNTASLKACFALIKQKFSLFSQSCFAGAYVCCTFSIFALRKKKNTKHDQIKQFQCILYIFTKHNSF